MADNGDNPVVVDKTGAGKVGEETAEQHLYESEDEQVPVVPGARTTFLVGSVPVVAVLMRKAIRDGQSQQGGAGQGQGGADQGFTDQTQDNSDRSVFDDVDLSGSGQGQDPVKTRREKYKELEAKRSGSVKPGLRSSSMRVMSTAGNAGGRVGSVFSAAANPYDLDEPVGELVGIGVDISQSFLELLGAVGGKALTFRAFLSRSANSSDSAVSEAVQQVLDSLISRLSELQDQTDKLEDRLDSEIDQIEGHLEKFEGRIKQFDEEIAAKEAKADELEKSLVESKEKKEELKTVFEEKKMLSSDSGQDVAQTVGAAGLILAYQEYQDQAEVVNGLEGEKSEVDSSLISLKEEKAYLEKYHEGFGESLEAYKGQREALQQKIKDPAGLVSQDLNRLQAGFADGTLSADQIDALGRDVEARSENLNNAYGDLQKELARVELADEARMVEERFDNNVIESGLSSEAISSEKTANEKASASLKEQRDLAEEMLPIAESQHNQAIADRGAVERELNDARGQGSGQGVDGSGVVVGQGQDRVAGLEKDLQQAKEHEIQAGKQAGDLQDKVALLNAEVAQAHSAEGRLVAEQLSADDIASARQQINVASETYQQGVQKNADTAVVSQNTDSGVSIQEAQSRVDGLVEEIHKEQRNQRDGLKRIEAGIDGRVPFVSKDHEIKLVDNLGQAKINEIELNDKLDIAKADLAEAVAQDPMQARDNYLEKVSAERENVARAEKNSSQTLPPWQMSKEQVDEKFNKIVEDAKKEQSFPDGSKGLQKNLGQETSSKKPDEPTGNKNVTSGQTEAQKKAAQQKRQKDPTKKKKGKAFSEAKGAANKSKGAANTLKKAAAAGGGDGQRVEDLEDATNKKIANTAKKGAAYAKRPVKKAQTKMRKVAVNAAKKTAKVSLKVGGKAATSAAAGSVTFGVGTVVTGVAFALSEAASVGAKALSKSGKSSLGDQGLGGGSLNPTDQFKKKPGGGLGI